MKKALIILLSVLACFIFVSCEEEPDIMTVDEFVDLYNEYLKVEYAIADEQTVLTSSEYNFKNGENIKHTIDESGVETWTYTLGDKVFVEKLDGSYTYTIDGISKTKVEFDTEMNEYDAANSEWDEYKTSGTKKYNVKKYDPDKTIVVNTKVEDLGDGTTECSYNATIDGENKVSYVYRTNSTSSTTYTYFKFNGVEVSPNAACLFILKD